MEDIKQCQVCATQEIFEALMEIGYDQDHAFHLAVTHLLSNVIETIVEESYDAGYEEGYVEASSDLAEIVKSYADAVKDEE